MAEPTAEGTDQSHAPTQLQLSAVQLADGQTVTNDNLLGPDEDLLPPYLATQVLAGQDYFEWCLRWNKLQDTLAERRSIPARTVRGYTSTHLSHSQRVSVGYGWWRRSGQGRHAIYSTSRHHEVTWRIGGYAGGPVTFFNPFVRP